MSFPTGTILVRKDPLNDSLDEIKVVGGNRFSMSVQSNLEFGSVFPLDADTARRQYGVKQLPDGGEFLPPGYLDPGRTPEEIFRDEQRLNPPAPDTGREALYAPPAPEPEIVVEPLADSTEPAVVEETPAPKPKRGRKPSAS